MSKADEVDEAVRDARRAHGALAVSLSILGDKIADAATLKNCNHTKAQRLLDEAAAELAAHGYLAMARDEHRHLNRVLKFSKAPA